MFDVQRKIGYCETQKVACTTFKALMANNTRAGAAYTFQEIAGADFVHYNLEKFPDLEWTYEYDIKKRENYTMFMAVRHPFDRLVSAYLNKAFPWRKYDGTMHNYYRKIQAFALKLFKHKFLTPFQREWYNATFKEFVYYTLSYNDRHWDSLKTFCGPCHVNYDYILRVETMERDSQVLMSDLYPDEGPLPLTNTKRKRKNNVSFERIQPKTLDIFSQLSQETLQKLMKKYAWDLEFYGYSFNTTTFQAECKFSENNCC